MPGWTAGPVELSAEARRTAGVVDYRAWQYVHTGGASAQVILLWGDAASSVQHTPEICFPGGGYKMVRSPLVTAMQYAGPSRAHSANLWSATFQASGHARAETIVLWAWREADGWVAPPFARLHFAGARRLLKLYVCFERPALAGHAAGRDQRPAAGAGSTPPALDPLADTFLKKLLSELDRA
jgi:hypothetical protein